MEKFEFIEHTADIGVRVYGKTLEDLFVNSATALFNIFVDYKPKERITREIVLEAQTLEDLLVNWLNELISGFFADKFLPSKFCISISSESSPKALNAVLTGERFNPYRKEINVEVKAATYHGLKIVPCSGGYAVEIIFDV
jgi:SHS2 domain-containing protein